ncbi:glycosyl hydrolase [Phyllobacterium brassicacearum]|uniref:Glycosyl hydrolase n=2 Tax=Phyllobacterium brassicacearum TaxID=314235 RepID=A0A2P7BRL1_9HYPH|nr:glycosyl hydrolase [Phyllobacterium brassicacearum]
MLRALFCIACWTAATVAATATTFTMQHGLNLDIWTTWPGPERWDEEPVLANFPEWRQNANASNLQDIRKAGFDFVRMPIDPAIFLEDASDRRITRLIAETLKSVDMLHAVGLKVIVDFHSIPSDVRKVGTNQILADKDLFGRYLEVAGRLGKALSGTDPATTAFEPFNEPVVDCDPTLFPKWPAMLEQLHAAARKAMPKHTLILSGGCWSSAFGLAKIDPGSVADDNIIWAFHTYEPYVLTHQGADWTGDSMSYVEGLPYPPDLMGAKALDERLSIVRNTIETKAPEERRDELLTGFNEMAGGVTNYGMVLAMLNEPFDKAEAWGKEYGIPSKRIYLGEFGMIRQEYRKEFRMPSSWRAAYLKDVITAAEKRGFPWSVWSWGGAFGITLDDEKRAFDPVILKGLGLKAP